MIQPSTLEGIAGLLELLEMYVKPSHTVDMLTTIETRVTPDICFDRIAGYRITGLISG